MPYGAMLALNLLERLNLQPGARVLVNGASGGIGALVVQIAKHRYHANVTGVCSTAKVASWPPRLCQLQGEAASADARDRAGSRTEGSV
jgi:NADPH:quinone reductase-like Zn-dependent oxidoreductase